MTHARLAILLALACSGVAHAGDTGAGPAGTGSSAVGSIISPGSSTLLNVPARDDYYDRILPGNGGIVMLAPEQVARAAEALRGFVGASIEGDVVRAPTTLADGTPAIIALDTRNGRLAVTRQE